MKYEEAYQLATKVNANLALIIKDVLKEELGVDSTSVVATIQKSYGGWYVIFESADNTTELLSSNKMLKRMFEKGNLRMVADQLNGEVLIDVDINYTHPDGSCNGLDLIRIYISDETHNVTVK